MSTDHPRLVVTKIAYVVTEVPAFGIGVVSGREREEAQSIVLQEGYAGRTRVQYFLRGRFLHEILTAVP
jgi:hypothetical protein